MRYGPSAADQRRTYAEHRAKGLCAKCTERATHGSLCRRHRNIAREAQTRKNQNYFGKKKEAGICLYCEEPATKGVVCVRHKEAQRNRYRARVQLCATCQHERWRHRHRPGRPRGQCSKCACVKFCEPVPTGG